MFRMTRTYVSSALDLAELARELDLLDPDAPVAVAVTDLDGFTPFNVSEGVPAGDALLGRVEAALRAALPPGSPVAHVRGDEFAVALVDGSAEELLVLLDPVRKGIADREAVRLSAGVAARPTHGATADELLSGADAALVRSKRDGGDRVSIALGERMLLKTSYYTPSALHHLAKLARLSGRTEASLLREALDEFLARQREALYAKTGG
jgi:diguanylate cyclase (GGDEF)-like protein